MKLTGKIVRGRDGLLHYGNPHGPVVVQPSDVARLDKVVNHKKETK